MRREEQARQREEEQQRQQEALRIASIPTSSEISCGAYCTSFSRVHGCRNVNIVMHFTLMERNSQPLPCVTRSLECAVSRARVRLPILPEPPATLRDLLCGKPLSFIFSSTSAMLQLCTCIHIFGSQHDYSVTGTSGPYSFRVHGELCHRMGSLLPENPTADKSYAQLYIHDPDEALDIRQRREPSVRTCSHGELQDMLHNVNPFVPIYQQAYQVMSSSHLRSTTILQSASI